MTSDRDGEASTFLAEGERGRGGYASWPNQVERWFGIITQWAIRRGSFCRVKELIAKIEKFVVAYNKKKAPFNWTAKRIQSWKGSSDFARKSPGQQTS